MADKNRHDEAPEWVPPWAPQKNSIEYVNGVLTSGLLVLVGIYVVVMLVRGQPHTAAPAAAGIAVGGA